MAEERDALLKRIKAIARRIRKIDGERSELFAERLALFQQGRDLDPPITNEALASAGGVTSIAVIQALRKAREAAE